MTDPYRNWKGSSSLNTLQWLLRALERGEYRLKPIVIEDNCYHRVTTITLVPNELRETEPP